MEIPPHNDGAPVFGRRGNSAVASGAVTGNVKQFDREAFRLAVRRGVQGGKVVVFWNLPSRLFVADCFYPGCTEGVLDSDFLHPYLWALEFSRTADQPFWLSHGTFGPDDAA